MGGRLLSVHGLTQLVISIDAKLMPVALSIELLGYLQRCSAYSVEVKRTLYACLTKVVRAVTDQKLQSALGEFLGVCVERVVVTNNVVDWHRCIGGGYQVTEPLPQLIMCVQTAISSFT